MWAAHVISVLGVGVTFDSTKDAAGWIVVVGGAAGLVGRGVVIPVVRWARRLERVMVAVEEQLFPDSGFSLRDGVTQIQEHLGLTPKLPTRAAPTGRPSKRKKLP